MMDEKSHDRDERIDWGLPEQHPGKAPGDLFNALTFTARHWRHLLLWCVAGALAGGLGSLAVKNLYRAEAQLVVPRLGGWRALPFLSRSAEIAFDPGGALGVTAEKRFFERLARSRTISDIIIGRFDLIRAFGKNTVEETRRKLADRMTVEVRDDIIRIGYSDHDARRAADVCNATVEELQNSYLHIQTSKAHQKRVFLEKRLASLNSELRATEEKYRQEKEATRTIEPKDQAEMTLDVAGNILTQYFHESANLKVLELFSRGPAPELIRARTRMAELEAQLRRIDYGSQSTAEAATGPAAGLLPLTKVPEIELRLSRAGRAVELYQQLTALVSKEYETARIDEVNNYDTIPVLDRAIATDAPISPWRSIYMLAGALLFVLCRAAVCLLRDWADALKQASPESAEELGHELGVLGRWLGLS